MVLKLSEVTSGMALPPIKRKVTQEHINLYANASGDFNPIHINTEFARQTPLGGTIAHGMLILAYVSDYMTGILGKDWLTGGSLSSRFKAPARPGDVITVSGKVTKIQPESETTLVICEVLCQNQQGETVITCETKVRIKTPDSFAIT